MQLSFGLNIHSDVTEKKKEDYVPELRERVNIPFSLYINALQEIYSNKYQVRFLEKKKGS